MLDGRPVRKVQKRKNGCVNPSNKIEISSGYSYSYVYYIEVRQLQQQSQLLLLLILLQGHPQLGCSRDQHASAWGLETFACLSEPIYVIIGSLKVHNKGKVKF